MRARRKDWRQSEYGAMTQPVLKDLVLAVCDTVIDAADDLTALDQAIGDGDHGFNMQRGFAAVKGEADAIAGKPLNEALKAVGMTLVMKVGGASGPLYGTLFMGLGKAVNADDVAALDRVGLASAFAAAIEGVKKRGKSDVGAKTMLDVLAPVQAALADGADAATLRATAHDAAEATIPMLATRGRASFLGERSIGHMDPGARSSAMIVGALCDAVAGTAGG